MAKHQETVAQAFCVFGLPRATPLQPLSTTQDEEYVLANVCLITAGETPPDCYDVIMRTECGQRAVLSQGGSNSNHAKERDASTAIFLAQRLALRRHCPRPITALVLVDVEHGEEPPSGFEPVNRTADAELCSVGRTQLYVSRASGTSEAHEPLGQLVVLARERQRAPAAPGGFKLINGVLGPPKAERCLAVRRCSPCGLLQTPLRGVLLDELLREARPTASSSSSSIGSIGGGSGDGGGGGGGGGSGRRIAAAASTQAKSASTSALPSALMHFCLPQGARLRLDCPWPSAHEFALTDRDGARLYGCCLIVWEPLEAQSVLLMRPETAEERSRAVYNDLPRSYRPPPPTASWDAERREWSACTAAGKPCTGETTELIRSAFASDHRVVITSRAEGEAPEALEQALEAADHAAEAAAVASASAAAEEEGEREQGLAGSPADTVHSANAANAANAANSRSSSSSNGEPRLKAVPPRRRLLTRLVIDGSNVYAPTALCVLSRHPFLSSLRRWLCELYRRSLSRSSLPLERLIGTLLWEAPLPKPTVSVSVMLGRDEIRFCRPAPASELPVGELRLASLVHALQPDGVVRLFAAALVEHKLILVSKYCSQLTMAAESLLALLWPVGWLNVYIPLLPLPMVEVLGSPVPYLLGVHTSTYEHAEAEGALPDDAIVVWLDTGKVEVPSEIYLAALGGVPELPDEAMLLDALRAFNEACPASEDGAAQSDLAFPIHELGGEAKVERVRDLAQQRLRHAFASWWAKQLHGYQDYLRTAGVDKAGTAGTVDTILDSPALLASRAAPGASPRLRPLLVRMLQTQGLVRMLEQRAGFSTRDAELVLFDSLADQYRRDAPTPPPRPGALPTLPRALPARVYSVPMPEPPLEPSPATAARLRLLPRQRREAAGEEAATFGPYACWPRLRPELLHVPRPIPPLNLTSAPPSPPPPPRWPPPPWVLATLAGGPDAARLAPSQPYAWEEAWAEARTEARVEERGQAQT